MAKQSKARIEIEKQYKEASKLYTDTAKLENKLINDLEQLRERRLQYQGAVITLKKILKELNK